MIIRRVKLKNFLAHHDSDIEFNPNGITAIIGENGSGKSSIIEGIHYAFFGESDKGNNIDLVKWGRKEAIVELEFENQTGLYKIHREIRISGKSTNTVGFLQKYEKGDFRLFLQKNLNKELPKITGITKKTFSSSSLVKQGEIEGLLNLKPKDRERVIEELLGIEYYQRVLQAFMEEKRDIKIKLEELERYKVDVNQLKEEKKQVEEIVDKINKQIGEKNVYMEMLKKDLFNITEKIKEGQMLKSEYNLKKDIENKLITELENLNQRLKEIEIAEKKFSEVERRYNQYIRGREKLNTLQEIEKLIVEKNSISVKIDQLNQSIDFIKGFESKALEFEKKQQKIKQVQTQIQQIVEKMNNLEKLEVERKNLLDSSLKLKEDIEFLKYFEEMGKKYKESLIEAEEIQNYLQNLNQEKGQLSNVDLNLHELENQLKIIYEKLIAIADELMEKYNRKFQMLKQNPLMVDEHINQSISKTEYLQNRYRELSEKLSLIVAEGEIEKKKIDNLQSIQGVCPTCNRPFQDHEKEDLLNTANQSLLLKREEYKKLKQNLSEVEKQLKEQEYIRDKLKEFKDLYEKYKERESQKIKLNQEKNRLSASLSKLQNFQNRLNELRSFLQRNQSDYAKYSTLKDKDVEAEYKGLQEKLEHIQELIDNLSSMRLNEQKKQLEEEIYTLEDFIRENTPDYGKYKTIIKTDIKQQLLEETQKLEKINIELSHKLSSLSITESDLEGFKSDLKKELQEGKSVEEEFIKVAKTIKDKENVIKDIQKKTMDIENLEKDLSLIKKKLGTMDLENLQEEKSRIEESIKNTEEDIRRLLEIKSVEYGKVLSLDEKISKAEEMSEELQKLKDKMFKYEKVIQTFQVINKLIKDNALYHLPKITQDIFSRFNFSNFSGLKFDEDYSILLTVSEAGTKEYTSIDSLSGGQKIALALSLRFAISKMLNFRSDFLILDEPGIYMDKYRRRELIDIIGDLKEKNFVKQLIIVTHDEETEDRADTIYKVDMGVVQQI